MSTLTINRVRDGFVLESSMRVPRRLDEVFAFFADARNLERLTPPFVRFRIVTPTPLVMREGLEIDYKLRIRGLPVRWRSEIAVWDPPRRFVDVQVRGPYRKWIHEHRFTDAGGETLVEDRVEYGVPGGRLAHRLFVRRDVERIFAYRAEALAELLAGETVEDGTPGAAAVGADGGSP